MRFELSVVEDLRAAARACAILGPGSGYGPGPPVSVVTGGGVCLPAPQARKPLSVLRTFGNMLQLRTPPGQIEGDMANGIMVQVSRSPPPPDKPFSLPPAPPTSPAIAPDPPPSRLGTSTACPPSHLTI